MTSPDETILTIEEAAAFARVEPKLIRHWMTMGLRWFSATKSVGRRGPNDPRFLKSDLLEFIRSRLLITRMEGPPVAEAVPRRRCLPRVETPGFDWRPRT